VKEASSRTDFIVTTHILDITDEAVVEKTLDQVHATFGRIDYAVNNAGVCKHDGGGVAQTTTETWKRTIGVNLTGLFFCLRMELKIMLKQERKKASAM
jgi:NAD(P)-dependent dehydrogenase (short-subunit alcohol dehydrogenase family)